MRGSQLFAVVEIELAVIAAPHLRLAAEHVDDLALDGFQGALVVRALGDVLGGLERLHVHDAAIDAHVGGYVRVVVAEQVVDELLQAVAGRVPLPSLLFGVGLHGVVEVSAKTLARDGLARRAVRVHRRAGGQDAAFERDLARPGVDARYLRSELDDRGISGIPRIDGERHRVGCVHLARYLAVGDLAEIAMDYRGMPGIVYGHQVHAITSSLAI